MQRLLERPWLAAIICLAAIVGCHSPRWWIIAHEMPGSFEWDRALAFLRQCQEPLRTDVEPAMRSRFLPQAVVALAGGNRTLALAFPWFGCWALLAYVNALLRQRGSTAATAAWLTIALGSSAPLLVSTGWLGINDAWVGLALCYLAFGQNRGLLVLACVAGPFIDERFVFGIPAAVCIRNQARLRNDLRAGFIRVCGQIALAVAPFLLGRAGLWFARPDPKADFDFLAQGVQKSPSYLWVAPVAIWMAFRFAYLPVLRQIIDEWPVSRGPWLVTGVAALVPLVAGFALAADVLRTAGILLPVVVAGALAPNPIRPRHARWLALANLLVPAAHVTFTHVVPINSLPWELWRWWR